MKERGYFGIGIINCKSEVNVGGLWRSAHALGSSYIFTIGRRFPKQASDVNKTERHVPLYEYQSWEEFTQPKGCELVAIEIVEDSTPLPRFNHPSRACYLLGAEDSGIPAHVLDDCQRKIWIPSTFCLNVATAGSIVMYDRVSKMYG